MSGQEVLDAAARLERTEGLDPWTALMRVLVTRLREQDVPSVLAPVVATAARHWSGQPGDLRGGKVEVWRYLDTTQRADAGLATPEGRAARALLCVLEPAGDDEARCTTAEWFAAMVRSALDGADAWVDGSDAQAVTGSALHPTPRFGAAAQPCWTERD